MAFAGTPDNQGIWVEIGTGVQCDTSAGEKYIKDSSGKLPSVWRCKQSCEDSAECQSITYRKSIGWCSHFSTPCTNRDTGADAVSMRLDTSGLFLVCGVMICIVYMGPVMPERDTCGRLVSGTHNRIGTVPATTATTTLTTTKSTLVPVV